ncbi:SIS domain-containing protein [Brenneria rubrifaciens]|uniref:SIS domain-containing protein n=1 Tax=Brenneria rubrifaciens TaxID=55213 RepID=A0A4P8QSW7_9GAMM|nr:SIS domain-containing protein [Brenneria rubrifaciens]QCR10198.1 SIS domain-containing protein [Brenneria rubrifaciens]
MTNFDSNTLAIGARIRMALSRLSLTEKSIAEWLIIKGNINEETSLKEVAAAMNVSEPLIVKVAKKLGYQGFRELRAALISYFGTLPFDKELEISQQDNLEVVLDKVFNTSIQSLKEAKSVADTTAIAQAAALITQAKHVVILGVGGSASVCQDFEHKLLRIGIHSHSYSDYHLMLMVCCQLEEDDVVMMISHSGDTIELLKAAQVAKQCNAKIICITNDDASPLSQCSDLSIFSPAHGGPLLGQNAVARIVQLNLLDTLFIAIVLRDYQGTRDKLDSTREVVKPLHGKNTG